MARALSSLAPTVGVEKETIRRVTWRLMPLITLGYSAAILTRSNVSLASLTMNHSLGFSSAAYGIGSGIFFVGYFLFGIPSTLILTAVGARRWIAGIMLAWALISALTACVRIPGQFYAVRFLLGAAEAGFYPGAILYITWWYPSDHRSKANAMFMTASALANILAGPVSAEILSFSNKLWMANWQWLFVLEALPSLILGFLVLFYLTDKPAEASWLRPEQRQWLESQMESERMSREPVQGSGLASIWRNPQLASLIAVYIAVNFTHYGIVFSFPQLASEYGLSIRSVGFVVALTSLAGLAASILWAIHSDKAGERRFHAAASCLLTSLGLLAGALSTNLAMLLMALIVAGIGVSSFTANFWTLPTRILSGAAAGGGIALINSAGNLGGFLGPVAFGFIRESTSGIFAVLGVMAIGTLAAAIILVAALPKSRGGTLRS
jgi:ACS family tartrate transporter-like MFS transporter